jgi:hypothetical protein
LAGCGQGQDTSQLDEPQRAAWRRQALDWLRTELTAWQQLLAKNQDKVRATVRQKMQHWLGDTDFAGVRGKEALAKLPETERAAWQELWAQVEALQHRAEGDTPPKKKDSSPTQHNNAASTGMPLERRASG